MRQPNPERPIRPLLSMWARPRATTRLLIARGPRAGTYFLGSLIGVSWVASIGSALSTTLSLVPRQVFLYSIFLGLPLGLLSFFIASLLYTFTGRLFGGKGTPSDMRIAIAWSYLPALPGLAFQLFDLAVLGGKFQGISPDPSPSYAALAATTIISILILLLGFYVLVLWYVAYAEAHGFSILRGIASVLVVGLMLGMLAGMAAALAPLLIFGGFVIYAVLRSMLAA